MNISININERLFSNELESYLSRLLLSDKISVLVHFILAALFLNIGELRLSAISVLFILYSGINFGKSKAFKSELKQNSDDLAFKVNNWKTFYSNHRRNTQLVFIISIVALIAGNFLSGMTISDMLRDSYTFILIPSFLLLSLLYVTKGFPSLPYILEKALD